MELIVPKTPEQTTSLMVVREETRIVELPKDRKNKIAKKGESTKPSFLMPEQPKGYLKAKDFDFL